MTPILRLPLLSLAAAVAFSAASLSAANLLTFDMGTSTFTTFTGSASGTAFGAANGTASNVDSNLTVGLLNAGTVSAGSSGLGNPLRSLFFTEGASGGDFNGADEAAAVTGTDFLQFTVTPGSGYSVSYSGVAFDFTRGGAAAFTTWFLRADTDSYATTVASGSFGSFTDSTFRNTSGSISATALQNVTTATSFRLYAYGATGSAAKRLDQIVLSGTVSAVPEPSTYAALAGVAVLGLAALRRRRA